MAASVPLKCENVLEQESGRSDRSVVVLAVADSRRATVKVLTHIAPAPLRGFWVQLSIGARPEPKDMSTPSSSGHAHEGRATSR